MPLAPEGAPETAIPGGEGGPVLSRTLTLGLVVYFSALAGVFWLLRESATAGFELSIYAKTPLPVWVFLFGSLIGGLAIIAHEVFSGSRRIPWQVGFLLLLIANFIVAALPALRGYFLFTDADPLAHFAMAREVAETGSPKYNIYPLMHITMAAFRDISGISLLWLLSYLPAVFTLANMASVYLLATALVRDRRVALLTAAASATLLETFHQTSLNNRGFGGLILPLVVYLYLRSRQKPSLAYNLPLMALVLAYPLWHPHEALMLIVLLSMFEISRTLLRIRRERGWKPTTLLSHARQTSVGAATICLIVLIAWMSRSYVFDYNIITVWLILTGNPLALTTIKGASALHVSGWDLPLFFLKSWGQVFAYLAITAVGAWLVMKALRRRDVSVDNLFHLLVAGVVGDFIAIFSLVALYFARGITTAILNRDALIPMTPVFVAFVLVTLLGNWKRSAALKVALAATIIGVPAATALLGLHNSPWLYRVPPQITRASIAALGWAMQNKPTGNTLNGPGLPQGWVHLITRWDKSFESPETSITQTRINNSLLHYADVPPHFGYDTGPTLAEAVAANRQRDLEPPYVDYLLLLTEHFRSGNADPSLRTGFVGSTQDGRWDIDAADIQRLLHDDSTVNKVYSNGDTDIIYVKMYDYVRDHPE